RQQNVGFRQVKLAYSSIVECGLNLKAAATLIIKEGYKHRRRIETRIAEKINRTINAHEGERAHIADHAVVFNRFEAHAYRSDALDIHRRRNKTQSTLDRAQLDILYLGMRIKK